MKRHLRIENQLEQFILERHKGGSSLSGETSLAMNELASYIGRFRSTLCERTNRNNSYLKGIKVVLLSVDRQVLI
jgi:hypothetical protein